MSLASEENQCEAMLEKHGKSGYHFVMCLLADGRAIGIAGLHELDLSSGNAAFGISVDEKDECSNATAPMPLNAICDIGFGELRLERIWLESLHARRAGPPQSS